MCHFDAPFFVFGRKLNNVDALFLPCDYVRRYGDGKDAEITKPSQTAA